MKAVLFFAALCGLFIGLTPESWAAVATPVGETSVFVKWGEWASWALTGVGAVLSGIWASAQGIIPGPVRWAIKVSQIDQVIFRTIEGWMLRHAEEIEEKGWTVDLKNQAVRDVVVGSLNTGNKFVKASRDSLKEKVEARLQEYIMNQIAKDKG